MASTCSNASRLVTLQPLLLVGRESTVHGVHQVLVVKVEVPNGGGDVGVAASDGVEYDGFISAVIGANSKSP